MSNEEQQIVDVLKTLLPAMEADGGGVELVSYFNGVASVRFRGTCLTCPSIGLTSKFGVTKTLQEQLPWLKEVVRVP